MHAFPTEKKTSCPGRSDTRALRGTPFDRPDILSPESHGGGCEATRRRRLPGRATAKVATLTAVLLLLLTLLACGSEDSQEERRTRPPRDTATPAPTESVDVHRTARATATLEWPATERPEERMPSPVANRTATPVSSSRAQTGGAAPGTPAPTPATQTGGAAPTAPAPRSTPAAQTVDICNRQESVRVAILGELDLDACGAVLEERLRQITRLEGISVQRLWGHEFHGLDNLEYLSLEAVTFDLPITARGPILQNLKLLQLTFVPGELENANSTVRLDFSGYSNTGLERVVMTIAPGSLEFLQTFYPLFLNEELEGIKLHIVDHRAYGQEILKQGTPSRVHIPELIIEFGPTGTDYQGIYQAAEEAGESPRNSGVAVSRGELPWLRGGRVDSLTIINHDTDYGIYVDTNFIEDDTPAPMYVELRGFNWIHKDAFDRVRGPLTLHVDPDPEGDPHRLHFSEAVATPTGTGFLPLWSKNAPYPETPECNHGLVDIAERIYQDGWDTEQWILEANRFIGSNPEDCHTNSYVPVAKVLGNARSCGNQKRTFLRADPDNKDLFLQWEREWVHQSQPTCWMRREYSDGTVVWEGQVRGNSKEISLPEDSPYRWK